MRTVSLLQRAIITVLLIEFCCALALVGTVVWHEWRTRLRALEVTMQGRSDSLIGAVQDAEDPADNVMVDPAEFNPPATDEYAVYNPDGRLVGRSPHAAAGLVALGNNGFHNAVANGHPYRVLQRNALRIIDREENGGVGLRRPVIVVYAARADHVGHEVLEAVSFYALMSVVLLCFTAGILIYLLRRLLAPIRELAVEATAIKADSLAFRPPASVLRIRELLPLAEALLKTISRLRLAFETEHRFMSDSTHELKTAVAVVRSSIQLLGVRPRSLDEYRLGLDRVLADNGRVEELVSRMLTLARVSERSQPDLVDFDLAREVKSALDNIASFAEHRGVAVVSSLALGVRVQFPTDAIEVLVSNLVMNAVQHSSRGSEVRVTVGPEATGDRRAVLEVQDFGSGIAAHNLPYVFERFFREDPSRSRETGGVGLGLAICKSVVESAGGEIDLQSVQGKGTTVKAFLMRA